MQSQIMSDAELIAALRKLISLLSPQIGPDIADRINKLLDQIDTKE